MFDGLHLKNLQPVNDLQSHSKSLSLLPFYRPYTISYQSSVVGLSVSISCTVFEILTLICQQIKTSRALTTPIWGTVCHHKTNTSQANLCTKFDDFIFSHSTQI